MDKEFRIQQEQTLVMHQEQQHQQQQRQHQEFQILHQLAACCVEEIEAKKSNNYNVI